MSKEQEAMLKQEYSRHIASFADQIPELDPITFVASPIKMVMEPKHLEQYEEALKIGMLKSLAGFGLGVMCSVALTQTNPFNFLKKKKHIRIPVRLAVVTIPFLAVSILWAGPEQRKKEQIEKIYKDRVRRLHMTGNFAEMDPHGILFNQYKAQAQAMAAEAPRR